MKNLTKSIVRNADRTIDLDATRVKYDATLLANYTASVEAAEEKFSKEYTEGLAEFDNDIAIYAQERGVWDVLSAEYVDLQFDRVKNSLKGGLITKPTLISMAVSAMLNSGRIGFEQFKHAEAMVAAYLTDNKDILFTIEKGKEGGVRKIPQAVPAAPAPEAAAPEAPPAE